MTRGERQHRLIHTMVEESQFLHFKKVFDEKNIDFETLVGRNATTFELMVLRFLADPWTYLGYLAMILFPLVALSAWASLELLRQSLRERAAKGKHRKKRKKNREDKKAGKATGSAAGAGERKIKTEKVS